MCNSPRMQCSPDAQWDAPETESCLPYQTQDPSEMDYYRLRDESTPNVVPEVDYLSQLTFLIHNPVIDYYAMFDGACSCPGLGRVRNVYTTGPFIRFHGPKIREGLDYLVKAKEEKLALGSSSDDAGEPKAPLYKTEDMSISSTVITASSNRPRQAWVDATKAFRDTRAKFKSFSIRSTAKCAKRIRGTSEKFYLSQSLGPHAQQIDSRASSSVDFYFSGPESLSWDKFHKAINQRAVAESRHKSDMSINATHPKTSTLVDRDHHCDADQKTGHHLHILIVGKEQIIEPVSPNATVSSLAMTSKIQHPPQVRTMPIPDYLKDVPKTKSEWEQRAGLHSHLGPSATATSPRDDPFLQQPNHDHGKQPKTFVDFLCCEIMTFFFVLSIIVLVSLLPWIFLGTTPILVTYFFGRELVFYLCSIPWDRKSDLVRMGETLGIGIVCICVLHLLS